MDQFIDDEEEESCPLCVEEFDLSDKNFKPCPCGYQICQFCYNNIRTTLNGLCPACRRPYDDHSIEWKSISPEELANYRADQALQAKRRAAARQKEALKKEAESQNRKHLAGLRVVQKNLVYVTGMTPNTREPKLLDILRTNDYFGQYGEIVKIVVSKPRDAAGPHPQSVGVYVTYRHKEDAASCISCVNGSRNGDRVLKAQYGTTKYCSAYLRNETCTNRNCMFLHEAGDENETFTRRDMSSMNAAATNQHSSGPSSTHTPVARNSTLNDSPHQISASEFSPADRHALPSSASWADKPATSSRTREESTVADSPLPQVSEPSVDCPLSDQELASSPSEEPATVEPTPEVSEAAIYAQLAKTVFRNLRFSFEPPASLSDEEIQVMKGMPLFWDWRTSARRHALHEKRVRDVHGQNTSDVSNTEGGSLQLGGEPEDPSDTPPDPVLAQPGARMPGLGVNPMRAELAAGPQNLSAHPGSLAHPSLKPDASQSAALANALMNAQIQGIGNDQFRTVSRGMDNNKLAGSKFANQTAAVSQAENSARASHLLSLAGNQFYGSGGGVQGPPPGLKSTGTPPTTSGGNLYGQNQMYMPMPTGLNYNNAPNVRNSNEEVVRELMRAQRPPTGSNQILDTGKQPSSVHLELDSPVFRTPTQQPPPGFENVATPLANTPSSSRPLTPQARAVHASGRGNSSAGIPRRTSVGVKVSNVSALVDSTEPPASAHSSRFRETFKTWPSPIPKGSQENQEDSGSSVTQSAKLPPPPPSEATTVATSLRSGSRLVTSHSPSPTASPPVSVSTRAVSKKQRSALVSTTSRSSLTSSPSISTRGTPKVAGSSLVQSQHVIDRTAKPNENGLKNVSSDHLQGSKTSVEVKADPKDRLKDVILIDTKEDKTVDSERGGKDVVLTSESKAGLRTPKTETPSSLPARPVSPSKRPAPRTIRVVQSSATPKLDNTPSSTPTSTPVMPSSKPLLTSIPSSFKDGISTQNGKGNADPKLAISIQPSGISSPLASSKKTQATSKAVKPDGSNKTVTKKGNDVAMAVRSSTTAIVSSPSAPAPPPAIPEIVQQPIVGRMKKVKKAKPPKPAKVPKAPVPSPSPPSADDVAELDKDLVPEVDMNPPSVPDPPTVEQPPAEDIKNEVIEPQVPIEEQPPAPVYAPATLRDRLESVAGFAGLQLDGLSVLRRDQRIYLSPPHEDKFRLADLNSDILRASPPLSSNSASDSESVDESLHFGGQDGHSWTRSIITPEGDHLRALTPAEEQRYLKLERALKEQKAQATAQLEQSQRSSTAGRVADPNYYDHFHASISERRYRQLQEFVSGTAPISFPTNGLRSSLRSSARSTHALGGVTSHTPPTGSGSATDCEIFLPTGIPQSLDSSAIFDLPVPLHPLVSFQIEGLDQGGGSIHDHLNRFIVPAEPDIVSEEELARRQRSSRRLDTTPWAVRDGSYLADLSPHEREKVSLDMLLQGFTPSFRSIGEIDSLATMSTQATIDIEKRVNAMAQELRRTVGLD